MIKWLPGRNTKPEEPHQSGGNGILASELGRGGKFIFAINALPSTHKY